MQITGQRKKKAGRKASSPSRAAAAASDARGLLDGLRTAEVAELVWAVRHSGLLRADAAAAVPGSAGCSKAEVLPAAEGLLRDGWEEEVAALDADPSDLRLWLRDRPRAEGERRVGLYYEDLLHYAFRRWGAAPVALANHQVVVGGGGDAEGRTVGEIDFCLGPTPAGTCGFRHVEVAIKFYCCATASPSKWADFVSPDLGPSLDAKLTKMIERQAQMGSHPEVTKVLQQLTGGRRPEVAGCVIVQGRLFEPCRPPMDDVAGFVARHPTAESPIPAEWAGAVPALSTACTVGWWCRVSEVAGCVDGPACASFVYAPLQKPHWLAPLPPAPADEDRAAFGVSAVFGAKELVKHCHARLKDPSGASEGSPCVHVAVLAPTSPRRDTYVEVCRGFVVTDTWPQT